ncbi:MAG: transglycosylase SLT domain-containing protein [Desulfobacteraceae bacterium]|nr:transglycosylase SLT domain-containing protein [Desulfobacteraceae bacterium]
MVSSIFRGTVAAFLVIVTFCLASRSYAVENQVPPTTLPSLVESIRFPNDLFFCGDKVPLGEQEVRERLEKELLLALWSRPQVILWLKRASRFFPHIESVLKKEGLPDDLKYLAVIESGLRPHAGSSKGAIGFWQFMRATGRMNGLRVDSKVDERRNLFKSTKAACRYLKKLKSQFGSWPLASAAYNMGENGLASEIKVQGAADYYSLYLPLETQRYVFKIIAAKVIMKNAESYGFRLSKEDLYPVMAFDRVNIVSPAQLPLTVIARSARVSFKAVKDLNPEIRGYYLSKGKSSILIPKGAAKGFKKRFARQLKQWKKENGTRLHVVKRGENLTTIAKRYEMSLASLLRLNKLTRKSYIHPGDRLVVASD